LADLLDNYPATVVKGLALAARLNRRILLAELTSTTTAAVSGALDLAFNQGRGKVLEKWMERLMAEEKTPTRKPEISERALSFFAAMPRRQHQ